MEIIIGNFYVHVLKEREYKTLLAIKKNESA